MTYEEWIKDYVTSVDGNTRGKCGAASEAMKLQFSELRLACGFAHTLWGPQQHWWCVAPDGRIVDPTRSQFPGSIVDEYEELDREKDVDRIPIGVCYWCSGDIFPRSYNGNETFCSAKCEKVAIADLNRASKYGY